MNSKMITRGIHMTELMVIIQPIARAQSGYGPLYEGSVQLAQLKITTNYKIKMKTNSINANGYKCPIYSYAPLYERSNHCPN